VALVRARAEAEPLEVGDAGRDLVGVVDLDLDAAHVRRPAGVLAQDLALGALDVHLHEVDLAVTAALEQRVQRDRLRRHRSAARVDAKAERLV
jgi:hypothetical protein